MFFEGEQMTNVQAAPEELAKCKPMLVVAMSKRFVLYIHI